jgi:hypothetical protein
VDQNGKFKDRFYYTGDIYRLPFDTAEKKKTYLPCTAFGMLVIASLIGQGFIDQSSSRTVWVVMPYLFQFLPALYYGLGLMEYISSNPNMTKAAFEQGVRRMKNSMIGLIFLAIVSFLADLIYIFKFHVYGLDKIILVREAIYLFWHLLTVLTAFGFRYYYNRHFAGITVEKMN